MCIYIRAQEEGSRAERLCAKAAKQRRHPGVAISGRPSPKRCCLPSADSLGSSSEAFHFDGISNSSIMVVYACLVFESRGVISRQTGHLV